MFDDLNWIDMVLRGGLAIVLGGVIGWDRERHNKAAGIRTMMLVSLGAAGAMMAAIEVAAMTGDDQVRLDPLRVMSGLIGGIGFLGAGSIIQSRASVRGLTTAATIWTAASIGIAVGLGLYTLAVVLTGFVLVTLVIVTSLKGPVLPDSGSGARADAGDHTPRSDDSSESS